MLIKLICDFCTIVYLEFQDILENIPLPPIENRKCPVEGCDSTGHLGGLYEKHFSVEACPVFHNITKEESKVSIFFLEVKQNLFCVKNTANFNGNSVHVGMQMYL